jgi:hypothetical protein
MTMCFDWNSLLISNPCVDKTNENTTYDIVEWIADRILIT